MLSLIPFNTKNLENKVHIISLLEKNPGLVIVKLGASWCGPCKKIEPVLDNISLSPDMKDVIFMKFDANAKSNFLKSKI